MTEIVEHVYMSDGQVLCPDGMADAYPSTRVELGGDPWVIGSTMAPCHCHELWPDGTHAASVDLGLNPSNPSIPLAERTLVTA